MTRERIHEIVDVICDFNEKMAGKNCEARLTLDRVPYIGILWECLKGGVGMIESFYDATLTRDSDVGFFRRLCSSCCVQQTMLFPAVL